MRDQRVFLAGEIGLIFLLSGCISDLDWLGGSADSTTTSGQFDSLSSSSSQTEQVTIQSLGLQFVSDDEWDETAVRKVLHTFAYGGHATDTQIGIWADMPADQAIVEMLTFEEHNLRLSPVTDSNYDQLDIRNGTLQGLGEFWSSDAPLNGLNPEDRWKYDVDFDIEKIWTRATVSRGLNPFRQKIGLWETNYHMAVNRDATVFPQQIAGYYDNILKALEADRPYQDVITTAATSAAVAMQYGHFRNKFRDGVCHCNEDFAREYYQLYFGVLGDYDPEYHETVTIKNTARALTDISLETSDTLLRPTDVIHFGTEFHFPGVLEMLGTQYWGEDMLDRINQLSQDAINHPESLDNLPVKIIGDLADDNLDEAKIAQIRAAWVSMQPKNLLAFLRAYAVSTLFHSEERVKYLSSVDRYMTIVNKVGLNNEENYLDLHGAMGYEKQVRVFHPIHDVFGSQTGLEASSSSSVFRNNYNRVTRAGHLQRTASGTTYGRSWEKDWGSVVPSSESGDYVVRDVAEWLWQRFIADGLKHFGPLERAHAYALLASDRDLVYLVSPEDVDRIITSREVETEPALIALVDNLATQTLALNSADSDERLRANERIGQAINFIVGTPYIFVQEGR